ncbi:MAG: ATP-dependent DNA helicase RecQ [Mangrovibacterium sp.]
MSGYWGYTGFRPLQEEIIRSVAAGKDTLGLMPTGGGKSVTFQVYSLSRPGICLVITPLISLMKDQVENLRKKGIRALAVHSGMTRQEVKLTFDSAAWGDYKFLYLSPERMVTERFRERLPRLDVNLIVVDEAHCISQWGYDFRPSYLRIRELRDLLPGVNVLALTATATPEVVGDIQKQLRFPQKNVLRTSFFRENLSYLVRRREDRLPYLLQSVRKASGSGIVYVRTRKMSRELADFLKKNGQSADYYHAGLSGAVRSRKQEDWKTGKTRIIVATNAFGMGIDKPDVRFVIHVGPPDSPEAYFQEAGRAGRDGKKAFAVLISGKADELALKKRLEKAFPAREVVRKVYLSLGNYFQLAVGYGREQIFDFNLADFAGAYNLSVNAVLNSLKILQREGYLELTEELDNPSRIHFTVDRDDLYRFQVANASFDGFIKLLLRSYSGLFTNYVGIDEDMLAKRAAVPVDTVYRYLNLLNSNKIIHYIPRKKAPYIIFTRERLAPERIRISRENYTDRKQDARRRMEAMIRYMREGMECRSRLLLSYFGERDSPRCGKCDTCLSLRELPLTAGEFNRICLMLKESLQKASLFEELIFRTDEDEEKLIGLIRWLIDHGKIVHRVDNRLEWKELPEQQENSSANPD